MRNATRWFAAALATLVALAVAGCGGDGGGTTSGNDTTGAETSEAAGGGAQTTTPTSDFRVAMLLPGSVSDRGYNADAQRSAELMRERLGAEVTVSQNVAVPSQTDVYRQFASSGYDLVIGWGGQFTEGAVTAASEFPDVQFLVVNSNAKNGANLSSFDTKIEDWEFIGGFVTAKLSKTNTIGWVGGQCFEATAANLHGVEQGARYANPKIKVVSTFTGDFEDPTKAQQAAQALIDSGAGALTGNLNNGWFGVFKAATSSGNVPVVTEWIDNHELSPTVIASAILKSQATFVADLAERAQQGTLAGEAYLFGLPENWGPAIAKTELIPDDVYQEALDVQAKIASGEIKPKHQTACK